MRKRIMRKLLFMGVIAAAALCLIPDQSHAQGLGFGYHYGTRSTHYTFLGRLATHHMMWIHQDGPLYNYGPYHGPGHVTMHIPKPWHGAYVPGDYTLWNSGGGGYAGYAGYGYSGAGAIPPQQVPAAVTPPPAVIPHGIETPVPPMPKKIPPVTAERLPTEVIPVSASPALQLRPVPPSPYHPIYPSWLTGR
jgi:hypothetical protein